MVFLLLDGMVRNVSFVWSSSYVVILFLFVGEKTLSCIYLSYALLVASFYGLVGHDVLYVIRAYV